MVDCPEPEELTMKVSSWEEEGDVFEDGDGGAGWVGECDVGDRDVPWAWFRRGR